MNEEYYACSTMGIVSEEEIIAQHWDHFCLEKSKDSERYLHIQREFTRENCIRDWMHLYKGYPIIMAQNGLPIGFKRKLKDRTQSFKERRGMMPVVFRGEFVEGIHLVVGDVVSVRNTLWIARKVFIGREWPELNDERYYYFSGNYKNGSK